VANVYLELLKNSYTSISTRKDKKKADEVRSTIVYLSKEIVFRNDIVGDLKKDIVNTINKRSCDLLDAYNIKAFEIPKPEEILFSHMIKIKEGFVLLVQRPNIIVIYNVNEELDKLKNLSALRIKASSCMKPTLFIDEELMISYYDPDTSSTRIVNMNGKEVKVINGKGIIYSSVNGPSIIMEDLSLVGKFDSLGKIKSSYDISNLTIAFGPILTKETETWFCKLNDDSYVLVLMKNSEIILISDPFRLGTMSSASSISITKDGSSTITQLDKILIVDVKYFIKLIEMTN
jgi:hypothetical protein